MKFKILLAIICLSSSLLFAQPTEEKKSAKPTEDSLVIVLSSADPLVAERMVFMYSQHAKKMGWFKDVTIVIWGPSAKMLTENEKLQKQLVQMIKDGVVFEVCKACSDTFNASKKLKELGCDVKYMGVPLTNYLKSEAKVMTF